MTPSKQIEELIGRVPLSQGKFALVDASDLAWISSCKWSATRSKNKVYAVRGKPPVLMHRLIAGAKPRQIVDHKNGNGLDNRRSNLRITDYFGNAQNRVAKPSKTGFRGVHKHPKAKTKPYYVLLRTDDKYRNCGYFATAEEAAREYDRLASICHGEFAVLNFPERK